MINKSNKHPKIRTLSLTTLIAATTLATSALQAAESSPESSVSWDEPRSFSDMTNDFTSFDRQTFNLFSNEMEKEVQSLAKEYLSDDQSLEIEFVDVDLAGEPEPWQISTGMEATRIVRDIYPPRLKFHYAVKDREGSIITEGMAQVTDLAYLSDSRAMTHSNDAFYYEKELLSDWAGKHLDDLDQNEAKS